MSGKLPEGWTEYLLDKLAARASGHTPNKSKSTYWNGGIKWVSLADSRALDNGYIYNTDKTISYEGIKNSSAVILPAGTVVLSRDAGVGKSAILFEDMAVSQHFIAWTCDNRTSLLNWFLYYWLQINKAVFERQAVGSTIKTIGLPFFKKMKVVIPPFPEQQKIASILSTWDAAIGCVQQLLENSKQQKKALMQQLLIGKKRLPGFSEEWKAKKIKKIATRVTRQSDGKEYPILTISSLSGFVRQDVKYRRYMAGESVNKYVLLQYEEFAYNKGNSKTYQFGCVLPLLNFKAGLVPHVYVCFKLHDGYDMTYYKYLFENDYLKKQLGDIVNTGVRNNGLLNIKPEDFFNATVLIPPLPEQIAIANVLSAADAVIAQYEQKLANLQGQKKALMQQLLTGKKRVVIKSQEEN